MERDFITPPVSNRILACNPSGYASASSMRRLEKEYPDGLLIGLAISGGGFRGNATGDEDARRPEHDIRI